MGERLPLVVGQLLYRRINCLDALRREGREHDLPPPRRNKPRLAIFINPAAAPNGGGCFLCSAPTARLLSAAVFGKNLLKKRWTFLPSYAKM